MQAKCIRSWLNVPDNKIPCSECGHVLQGENYINTDYLATKTLFLDCVCGKLFELDYLLANGARFIDRVNLTDTIC